MAHTGKAAPPPPKKNPALKLIIKRDTDDGVVKFEPITSANDTVLPGQLMDLKVEVDPSSYKMSRITWSIPGRVFKDFVADQSRGTFTSLATADISVEHIKFYWANGPLTLMIRCRAEINGQTYSATAKFKVSAPSYTFKVKQGKAGFGSSATKIGLFGVPAGITFTGSVQVPAGFGPGQWNWVQITWPSRTQTRNDGVLERWIMNGKKYLDTTYPYEPSPYTSHPGSAGAYTTGAATQTNSDTPSTPLLSSYKRLSTDDEHFTTYLMFLPEGPNSRYVPLAAMIWRYSVIATRSATAGWSVDAHSAKQSFQGPFKTRFHPEWADNAKDHMADWVPATP